MSRAVRAHRRAPARHWGAGLLAVAAALPTAVRADMWTLDSGIESRFESNDNSSLIPNPSGTVNTLSLSSSLNAARQTESEATRVDAAVALLKQIGGGARDRVDGRLGVQQSFKDARSGVNLGLNLAQDFNSDVIGADVTQPRGRRRTAGLSAGWSYALSERLSASAQFAYSRAGYGSELTQASDYRNASVSGGVSYLLSEVDSLSSQLSHSRYRTASGSNRSTTDSVDVGLSHSFSERASASLNLGAYRTASTAAALRLVCPLQLSLCEAGLVPFVFVSEPATSARSGLQFSSAARYQVDETTGLSFSAARQQAPSGAGSVVRSDTLSIAGSRALSPTVNASLNLSRSRSSVGAAGTTAQPAQQALSLSLSRQLEPNLSLQAGYRHTRAQSLAAGGAARSNSVYIALSYGWAKFEAAH